MTCNIVLRTVTCVDQVTYLNRLFKSDDPLDAGPPRTVLPSDMSACPRKETTGVAELSRCDAQPSEFRTPGYNVTWLPCATPARASAACPALGNARFCAVCCGTKRLGARSAARATAPISPPPASTRRRRRPAAAGGISRVCSCQFMRDFNERQSQLFFLVATFLARYQPAELQSLGRRGRRGGCGGAGSDLRDRRPRA